MNDNDFVVIELLNKKYGLEFMVYHDRTVQYFIKDRGLSFEFYAEFFANQMYKEPLNIRLSKILDKLDDEHRNYVVDGGGMIHELSL